jgi:hypothetical protein
MKDELKQGLINNLRSGEYKQGRKRLRVRQEEGGESSFCCLGVLTDMAVKEGIVEWREKDAHPGRLDDVDGMIIPAYDEERQYTEEFTLPNAVANWACINSSPSVTINSVVEVLTRDDKYIREEVLKKIDRRGISDVGLATLNDAGLDFEDMADIIEELL